MLTLYQNIKILFSIILWFVNLVVLYQHMFGKLERWVILHLNLNRSNKVHPEFCLKSNLKTISALAVFAFHLVGNNTWIIFLVEGENISAGGGGLPMAKIFGNFIKTTFAPLASAFDPICCWYHLDYLSTALWGCNTWLCENATSNRWLDMMLTKYVTVFTWKAEEGLKIYWSFFPASTNQIWAMGHMWSFFCWLNWFLHL